MNIRWTLGVGLQAGRFLLRHPRALGPMIGYVIGWSQEIRESYGRASNIKGEIIKLQDGLYQCEFLYQGRTKTLEDRWYSLYKLIRDTKPDIVIETGVATGVSTAHILQALHLNNRGTLYSIDLPNRFYLTSKNIFHAEFNPLGQQSGYLIPEGLKIRWYLIIGPTEKELPLLLKKLDKIDVFLHDSEHTYETQMFEMEQAWPHIVEGGCLVVDDATWSTAFEEFSKGIGKIINGQGFLKKES